MLKNIQEELQARGIEIDINTFTNHDNFGINLALARYLKLSFKIILTLSVLYSIYALSTQSNKECIKAILALSYIYCENDNFLNIKK
jgi:hypothetical protein